MKQVNWLLFFPRLFQPSYFTSIHPNEFEIYSWKFYLPEIVEFQLLMVANSFSFFFRLWDRQKERGCFDRETVSFTIFFPFFPQAAVKICN